MDHETIAEACVELIQNGSYASIAVDLIRSEALLAQDLSKHEKETILRCLDKIAIETEHGWTEHFEIIFNIFNKDQEFCICWGEIFRRNLLGI